MAQKTTTTKQSGIGSVIFKSREKNDSKCKEYKEKAGSSCQPNYGVVRYKNMQ